MIQLILLDIPPDPARVGVLPAVILLVLALIGLLAAGLVVFLWYRKRSLREVEMIRPATLSTAHGQPGKPTQP